MLINELTRDFKQNSHKVLGIKDQALCFQVLDNGKIKKIGQKG